MTTVFTLDGRAVVDIASFYAQLNQLFMQQETWQLGNSLDALDDLLHAGHGALAGFDHAILLWQHSAASAQALGVEATAQWLRAKLAQPGVFNTENIQRQLQTLLEQGGPTYFERIVQVFADHTRVTLQLA